MRQRHAARVQRPHGLIPIEARSRIARTRSRIPRHTDSPNSAGWLPSPRPRDLLNPAGGLTEPTGPANIHVTKSPGTLLPRTARRIQSVKTPRPLSTTMARRNIHTYKSPRGLFQHSPEIHSHSQIPEAPASVHGRGNGIGLGMTTRRKRYCFQTGDDGNDDDDW